MTSIQYCGRKGWQTSSSLLTLTTPGISHSTSLSIKESHVQCRGKASVNEIRRLLPTAGEPISSSIPFPEILGKYLQSKKKKVDGFNCSLIITNRLFLHNHSKHLACAGWRPGGKDSSGISYSQQSNELDDDWQVWDWHRAVPRWVVSGRSRNISRGYDGNHPWLSQSQITLQQIQYHWKSSRRRIASIHTLTQEEKRGLVDAKKWMKEKHK